jgi:hypothetical protein
MTMALSNAERQARHRERVKAKLAAQAEPLRNGGGEVERLRKQVARLKEQLAEKEAQRAAQESMARVAWKKVDEATNRAMFAEADKERLAEELEALRNASVPKSWLEDAAYELHSARGTPVPDHLAAKKRRVT